MSVVKLPLQAVDPVTGLLSGADLSHDLNDTTAVAVFDVGPFDYFSIQGIPQAGTWSTGAVTIEFSNTGFTRATYQDALGSKSSTPSFDGTSQGLNDLFCKGFRYAIARTLTAQSGITCALSAWGSAEGAPGRAGRVAAGATGEPLPPPDGGGGGPQFDGGGGQVDADSPSAFPGGGGTKQQ